MKKIGNIKPGEQVIYKKGYDIIKATVVEKPIDDNERPKFLIGRVDLDNGDFLTRGTYTYESVDECKEAVLKTLMKELVLTESLAKVYSGRLTELRGKLKELEGLS